jgi:hypothetical protein
MFWDNEEIRLFELSRSDATLGSKPGRSPSDEVQNTAAGSSPRRVRPTACGEGAQETPFVKENQESNRICVSGDGAGGTLPTDLPPTAISDPGPIDHPAPHHGRGGAVRFCCKRNKYNYNGISRRAGIRLHALAAVLCHITSRGRGAGIMPARTPTNSFDARAVIGRRGLQTPGALKAEPFDTDPHR